MEEVVVVGVGTNYGIREIVIIPLEVGSLDWSTYMQSKLKHNAGIWHKYHMGATLS